MTASPTSDRLDWYRAMVRIRLFEEKVQELFMTGQIQGTTHLCQGQEAVSVGAIAAMRPGDVQTNTYRGHGEALALGMAPETAFAELMGRTTGGSGGVGGSMHLIDFSKGNIGANAIVGAGLPIAVGAAVAFQMQRKPNVALTFFGDGATNIGTFHESLNMAAVWKAPVVFIIAKLEAAERARRGDGPSLLEMKTYRYRGHSRSDPAKYRPAGELDAWKARDPIELLGQKIIAEGHIGPNDPVEIRGEIQADIDAAAERAATAPFPTLEETRPYVYAD
jgi:TPP-dependent pyruvate/acetoin dehydrogenase alpha subunit